ncbi:LuxR C-terminal-related transcriptional regulator [Sphingomonas sp.]|uniref:LuxR C-terminal-related transcriptional regulator n=1 Tax=Sphingomonas sp. TaxID=28214 RepID=UPI002897DC25|nr:LuxR C-terminal-related transcriptional regulator [Sphingomonas sp.]
MEKGLGENRGLFCGCRLGHDRAMSETPFNLTDKEAAVLHLLARGHDVKSAAAELGLSIHTVHERLREARRKTGASSSRGAARLLTEGTAPNFSGGGKSGVSAGPVPGQPPGQPRIGATDGPRLLGRWGIPVLISATTTLAILAATHLASGGAAKPAGPPRVAATSPAANSVVQPGSIDLTVTFDRPMRPNSYSFVYASPETYPDCGHNQPVQSADRRTFTLTCSVQSGRLYEVWINSPAYRNFVDENGVAATPYRLQFRAK